VESNDAVQGIPLEVTIRRNETADRMIKRFSKKVRNDGILKEFTSKLYFEKPSVVKRRKRAKAKWESKSFVRK